MPELKPLFAAQKIPPELVWLAEVESSFDRRALVASRSGGAVSTDAGHRHKRFGLSLWPRDQRKPARPARPPPPNTSNHFTTGSRSGAWPSPLSTPAKAPSRNSLDRCKTRAYDDISRHLPAETQMYDPARRGRCLATRRGEVGATFRAGRLRLPAPFAPRDFRTPSCPTIASLAKVDGVASLIPPCRIRRQRFRRTSRSNLLRQRLKT